MQSTQNQNENPGEFTPKTDFEKLLFSRHHVKCLQQIIEAKDGIISKQGVEIGVLKSDLSELTDVAMLDVSGAEKKVISQRKEILETRRALARYKELYQDEILKNQLLHIEHAKQLTP